MKFRICLLVLIVGAFSCPSLPTGSRAEEIGQDRPASTGETTAVVGGIVRLPRSDDQSQGQPAANADVFLRTWKSGATTLPTRPLRCRTDEQGRFEFSDVPDGNYRLWAETDQWTTLDKFLGGEKLTIKDQESPNDVSLQLKEGCRYEVRVRSTDTGLPIENAEISFGWTDIERSYLTDAKGIARIGGLVSRDWFFVVKGPDHATEFKKLPAQDTGTTTELEFELHPGGSIAGVLKDETGKPVADARLTTSSTRGGMLPNFARVQTDKQGQFQIDGLPVGEAIRLSCRPDGFERLSEELVIPAGQTQLERVFRIRRRPYGGDCLILVTNEESEPIAGATLRNQGNSSALVREGVTDADGLCLMSNLFHSFSGCTVTARARGFISKSIVVEPGTKQQPAQVIVRLAPGKTLRGRLLTPAREPAAKVRVYFNHGENGADTGGRVETDSEGRFEIDGLEATVLLTVYTPRQYAPITKREFPVDEQQELELLMTPAAVIRVRAVDAFTGKPIPEFNVRLSFCRDRRPDDPSPGGISSSLIEQGENVMGTKKVFTLDHQQPATPYEVIVSADGYEPITVPRVVAAVDAEVLDVALHRIDPRRYRRIQGRLTGADGEPVVGAKVGLIVGSERPELQMVTPENFKLTGWDYYHWDLIESGSIARQPGCLQFLKTATDAKGQFRLDEVRADAVWYELFHDGGGVAPGRFPDLGATHAESLERLELQAQRPAKLVITVDPQKWPDAHGAAIGPAGGILGLASLEDAIGYQSATFGPDSGAVEFDGLPPGDYSITLQAPPEPRGLGFRVQGLATGEVTVEAGETTTYRFE